MNLVIYSLKKEFLIKKGINEKKKMFSLKF